MTHVRRLTGEKDPPKSRAANARPVDKAGVLDLSWIVPKRSLWNGDENNEDADEEKTRMSKCLPTMEEKAAYKKMFVQLSERQRDFKKKNMPLQKAFTKGRHHQFVISEDVKPGQVYTDVIVDFFARHSPLMGKMSQLETVMDLAQYASDDVEWMHAGEFSVACHLIVLENDGFVDFGWGAAAEVEEQSEEEENAEAREGLMHKASHTHMKRLS